MSLNDVVNRFGVHAINFWTLWDSKAKLLISGYIVFNNYMHITGHRVNTLFTFRDFLRVFTWIIIFQLLGNYQGYQSTLWEYVYEVLWSYEC